MKKLIFNIKFGALLLVLAITSACQKDAMVSTVESEGDLLTEKAIMSGQNSFLNPGVLDASEIEALEIMREEELLARDVYLYSKSLYPLPIFKNIAKSEQVHTSAIKNLLTLYGIPDPAVNHQNGVFRDQQIQALYDALTAQSAISLNDALYVGAIVEDMDIYDLMQHLANDVDNPNILKVFNNLLKGSKNHLRAFNVQLVKRGITYVPQYINQQLFDSIINGN